MKTIILTGFIFFGFLVSYSQHGEKCMGKHEKIKAEKVAFITNRLNLTVDEAQKFWPLYNEMEGKMQAIKDLHKCNKTDLSNKASEMTDKEMDETITAIMDNKVKIAQIEQEYFIKFKKVLPIKKVWELHAAEKDFMHDLLKKLKECHDPNKQGPEPRQCDF
ncbi:MAG: hypothetical protein ABIJ97_05395 [Bacteroidota bacterium]